MHISTEQFKDALAAEGVLQARDLELLRTHYGCRDCSATAGQLTRLVGYQAPIEVNRAFGGLGHRIANHLHLTPSTRDNDTARWWSVLANGAQEQQGFVWTLRDELVSALAELRLLEGAYPTAAEFDHYARTVLEGASTTKPATVRNRCDALLAIAREHYRGADGILRCEVCQWARPFQLSADIVELHHRNPLAAAPQEGRQLTLDDAVASLSPLCPNCHRVAHAKPDGSIYSIDELRRIIPQSNVA